MSHEVAGYEKSDVNVKKVVIALAGCVALIGFFMVVLDQYFLISTEKMYFKHVLEPESIEFKELTQKETQVLSNYKVLDKNKGVYQIPIQRAMELEVLEKSK
ncbi:MAG: hypothetical protein IT286_04605 [Proteobacteria bacterium]|jgi:hypothetical protein|nr:hypothetical protein [Pseudomonadota bacterium]